MGILPTQDRVLSVLSADGRVQMRIAHTRMLSAELTRRHELSAYCGVALRRALSTATLIPMTWKDADRITVQWAGVGSIGSILVEVRSDGSVRGYASKPKAIAPRAFKRTPRPHTIGYDTRGHLVTTRQARDGKHSQSDVVLFDGSIDGDVEHWMRTSEQIPTAIRVDENKNNVTGVLVQSLPGDAGEAATRDLPNLNTISDFTSCTDSEIIDRIMPGGKILAQKELHFRCPCSRDRTRAGLAMLDEQELLEMMMEDEKAEVICQFCAENYHFDAAAIAELIDFKHNLSPDIGRA